VMSDEIYAELIYEGQHVSIATFPGMKERTVILDGFSKTYAMTGWRLGYGIFPPELVPAISRLAVNSVSCTSVSTQRAGIAALTGPQDKVIEFREAFRARRDLIVAGLNAIDGISCVLPKGAFYAFPNITGTGLTSREFADRLLEEYGVAGIAGTSFGAAGEGYVRLSTANSEANLQKALDRVATMVADLKA
jgi:aspartate aminotransferase